MAYNGPLTFSALIKNTMAIPPADDPFWRPSVIEEPPEPPCDVFTVRLGRAITVARWPVHDEPAPWTAAGKYGRAFR